MSATRLAAIGIGAMGLALLAAAIFQAQSSRHRVEFFERVRTRMRAKSIADLCCGHGLTGLLFAAFERDVEHVTLIDYRKPKSYEVLLEAISEVAPLSASEFGSAPASRSALTWSE